MLHTELELKVNSNKSDIQAKMRRGRLAQCPEIQEAVISKFNSAVGDLEQIIKPLHFSIFKI